MLRHHIFRETGPRPISLTISSDTTNVNLFTLAGSPGTAVSVTLTINSGIWVGSTALTAGLRTGGFPAGSTITIKNNGVITGKGGDGNGQDGGIALQLDDDNVTIDNSYGNIWAPGGGGAQGYSEYGGGGGGSGGGQIQNRLAVNRRQFKRGLV
jgi:hypothetical protein